MVDLPELLSVLLNFYEKNNFRMVNKRTCRVIVVATIIAGFGFVCYSLFDGGGGSEHGLHDHEALKNRRVRSTQHVSSKKSCMINMAADEAYSELLAMVEKASVEKFDGEKSTLGERCVAWYRRGQREKHVKKLLGVLDYALAQSLYEKYLENKTNVTPGGLLWLENTTVFEEVLYRMAELEPVKAIGFLTKIEGGKLSEASAFDLALGWSKGDPHAAIEWWQGQDRDMDKSHAELMGNLNLRSLFIHFAAKDYKGALALANQQTDPTMRGYLLDGVMRGASFDAESLGLAKQEVMSLMSKDAAEDQQLAESMRRSLIAGWLENDSASAIQWYEKNNDAIDVSKEVGGLGRTTGTQVISKWAYDDPQGFLALVHERGTENDLEQALTYYYVTNSSMCSSLDFISHMNPTVDRVALIKKVAEAKEQQVQYLIAHTSPDGRPRRHMQPMENGGVYRNGMAPIEASGLTSEEKRELREWLNIKADSADTK